MSCRSGGTFWEVLNGVGVDGVGVIFPFFYAFFAFLRIFSFFFVFLRFSSLFSSSPKDRGEQQQFTAKMGNFTPTPSAPTPCKLRHFRGFQEGIGKASILKKILHKLPTSSATAVSLAFSTWQSDEPLVMS